MTSDLSPLKFVEKLREEFVKRLRQRSYWLAKAEPSYDPHNDSLWQSLCSYMAAHRDLSEADVKATEHDRILEWLREDCERLKRQERRNRRPRDQIGTGHGEGDGDGTEENWLTVSQAAKAAGTNTGTITRAVDAGELTSNGKRKRERRIDPAHFARWMVARASKPEPRESDEKVNQLVNKHCEN